MRTHLIDKNDGQPILEFIESIGFDAENDLAQLLPVVSAGRHGYELRGDELDEFIRRCLHSILDHGALPTVNTGGLGYAVHEATTQYGVTADAIVENVMAAWNAAGRPDPDWGEWAFSTPDNIEAVSLERFRKTAADG